MDEYAALQKNKAYRYVFFQISDDKTSIVPDTLGPRDATYDDFLSHFKENEPCYAVYDFHFEKPGGEGKREKVIFFSWYVCEIFLFE